MPSPVFIIVCSDVSQDRTTSRLSMFSLVERIEFVINDDTKFRERNGVRFSSSHPYKAVAVWLREEGDEEIEFEHEFCASTDTDSHAPMAPIADCQFRKEFHRANFILNADVLPTPPGTGTIWIESRLRRKGDQEWLMQRYPLHIELVSQSTPASAE